MFGQNDWWLKRMAEERINDYLCEAETWRMVNLAAKPKPRQGLYHRFLVRLGIWMSKVGDYLQMHFGASLQAELDHFSTASSPEK